jgi:hypothetical protein
MFLGARAVRLRSTSQVPICKRRLPTGESGSQALRNRRFVPL